MASITTTSSIAVVAPKSITINSNIWVGPTHQIYVHSNVVVSPPFITISSSVVVGGPIPIPVPTVLSQGSGFSCLGNTCAGNDFPVTNYSAEGADACDITPGDFVSPLTECSYVGGLFDQVFCAPGFIGPWTWQITGTLPPGLSTEFNFPGASQMLLTGTVTTSGDYYFQLTASDGAGNQFTKQVNIGVVAIPATLSDPLCGLTFAPTTTLPSPNQTITWVCANGSTVTIPIQANATVSQILVLIQNAISSCPGQGVTGNSQAGGGGFLPNQLIYTNTAQRSKILCASGSANVTQYYNVPPGVFFSYSQASANLEALAYANQMAAQSGVCFSCLIDDYENVCVDAEGSINPNEGALLIVNMSDGALAVFPNVDYYQIVNVDGSTNADGSINSLPPGLTFDDGFQPAIDLAISGTPTTEGTYKFTLQVTLWTPGPNFLNTSQANYTVVVGPSWRVTPNINSSAVSYFNNGANFPAGNFAITYPGGALYYSSGRVNMAVNSGVQIGSQIGGYILNDAGALSQINAPTGFYDTYEDIEALPGPWTTSFTHPGGPIGVYLLDTDYGDNAPAGPGAPSFILTYTDT